MRGSVQSFRAQAEAQAKELLQAIDFAEGVIVSTIDRECEALRAGRLLAADALRVRLRDAAKLYLSVTRAARASIWTIEQLLPGTHRHLHECRAAFAALLKVELAVLAAERAQAASAVQFAGSPNSRPPANVTPIRGRGRRSNIRKAG
jgi:hypothetical protein